MPATVRSCEQHSAVCCARRSNSLGIWSICGWRSVRAAVVWHEPRIANSRGPQRNVSFGSEGTVTYECYQGHATQSGSTQFNISCQANGTFTSAPSCLSVQCRTVPQFSFADASILVNTTVAYPSVINYKCYPGYVMIDRSSNFDVQCTAQGTFVPEYSDVLKPCRPVDCGSPIAFGNSHLLQEFSVSVAYPQQTRYRCNVGYWLDERAQDGFSSTFFASPCMATGTFSLVNDPCVPVTWSVPRPLRRFRRGPGQRRQIYLFVSLGYELLPNDGALQIKWVGLNLFVAYGPSLQPLCLRRVCV